MDHATAFFCVFLSQDVQCILAGITCMHNNRFIQFDSTLYMRSETLLLPFFVSLVVIVVETGFAYGDNFFVARNPE